MVFWLYPKPLASSPSYKKRGENSVQIFVIKMLLVYKENSSIASSSNSANVKKKKKNFFKSHIHRCTFSNMCTHNIINSREVRRGFVFILKQKININENIKHNHSYLLNNIHIDENLMRVYEYMCVFTYA